MGETMTKLDDFLKQVDATKKQQRQTRETLRPLYETAEAAGKELAKLEGKWQKANDVATVFRNGGDVTPDAYMVALDTMDELRPQIERQRAIRDVEKKRADDAGMKASYEAQLGVQKVVSAFDAWQRQERKQLLDAIAAN